MGLRLKTGGNSFEVVDDTNRGYKKELENEVVVVGGISMREGYTSGSTTLGVGCQSSRVDHRLLN